MPIYEYRCHNCGSRVEILVRPGDHAPSCPHCGSPLREKLLSAPYVMSERSSRPAGHTCCGREERCAAPPCSSGGSCRRG
ncbi:MAG: zinc ribbon domain-containing protein [Anaerolineae bacterium]|nr:zinc ribbon domain-containing protein [Anaerolineae bacterium]